MTKITGSGSVPKCHGSATLCSGPVICLVLCGRKSGVKEDRGEGVPCTVRYQGGRGREYHVLYGTNSFIFCPSQIELEKGDVIGVAGNHWDGFNKGRNHRNNK
jgi:hypothetical protein